MSLSLSDLHLLIDELTPQLLAARLQKVHVLENDALSFIFYHQRHSRCLLVSIKPGHTTLFLTEERWPKAASIANFALYCNKHLVGQVVESMDTAKLSRTCWLQFAQHRLVFELHHTHGHVLLLDHQHRILYTYKSYDQPLGSIYTMPTELHPRVGASYKRTDSINQQEQQAYAQHITQRDHRLAEKLLQKQIERQIRKIEKLNQERLLADDSGRFYHYGATLQREMFRLDKAAFYESRLPLKTDDGFPLPLPHRMNAQQALQYYFNMHKKLLRKGTQAAQRLLIEKEHLQRLEESRDHPDHGILPTSGPSKPLKKIKLPAGVRSFNSPDGFRVLIGKNASANDQLLKMAKGNDLWLHVRDFPGCHCIVLKEGKKQIPPSTIQWAATLALQHSKAKNQGYADVVITQRAYVKKFRHAKPGQVQVMRSKTMHVKMKS